MSALHASRSVALTKTGRRGRMVPWMNMDEEILKTVGKVSSGCSEGKHMMGMANIVARPARVYRSATACATT